MTFRDICICIYVRKNKAFSLVPHIPLAIENQNNYKKILKISSLIIKLTHLYAKKLHSYVNAIVQGSIEFTCTRNVRKKEKGKIPSDLIQRSNARSISSLFVTVIFSL